ncbi:MAG: ABC transporter ATP-binding protein [Proteobacteria bacterium]|nr:ABC transporter ATP-binding protein [Pseudomonadota bacterium]
MKIPPTLLKFTWYFLKKQLAGFIFIVITSWVWAVNESLFPYFIKSFVNTVANYHGNPLHIWSSIKGSLIAFIVLWVAMEGSMRTQGLVMMKVFPRLRAQMREEVFNYVRQHSHEFFANHFAGNIANKIGDLPSGVETILQIILFNFIAFSVAFLVALIVLTHVSLLFSSLLLCWAMVHLSVTLLFLKSGYALSEAASEATSQVTGKVVDSLTNILNVRLFARGNFETRYLQQFTDHEYHTQRRSMRHLEKMKFIQGLVGTIFLLTVIFCLIYGWSHSTVTLGDFTLVGMLSFSMLGFIWYASYQITIFVREAGKIRSALSLISTPHAVRDNPDALPLHVARGSIVFAGVTFGYQPIHPVFNQLSVTIPGGQKVGLVGFSGSGKSTLVNLLLRFYDIQAGEIAIDGQSVAKVTSDSLRKQIAMIPQDPSLFHRTLMENIRYGRANATDEEVIQAAKLAHCHEFIEVLDGQYHALVGERGVKLSGGQRQRIAIARAILKDAPILLLDEATSSLDSVTEKLIQKSLNTLMKNRTTIVIAHRLSTLMHMDRILVFDRGRVVEDGSVEELIQRNGVFALLWNMQADGFLPEAIPKTATI